MARMQHAPCRNCDRRFGPRHSLLKRPPGVPEPLVSAGKVVRDDDGQPIAIRRYSDALMIALLSPWLVSYTAGV